MFKRDRQTARQRVLRDDAVPWRVGRGVQDRGAARRRSREIQNLNPSEPVGGKAVRQTRPQPRRDMTPGYRRDPYSQYCRTRGICRGVRPIGRGESLRAGREVRGRSALHEGHGKETMRPDLPCPRRWGTESPRGVGWLRLRVREGACRARSESTHRPRATSPQTSDDEPPPSTTAW